MTPTSEDKAKEAKILLAQISSLTSPANEAIASESRIAALNELELEGVVNSFHPDETGMFVQRAINRATSEQQKVIDGLTNRVNSLEGALRFIAAQENLLFAECSLAKEIVHRIREALKK